MHFRRLATFLIGLWLGGGVFMDFVATQSFASVERLLPQVKTIRRDDARGLLRRHAAEQNRFLFEQWERVQFGLALALFLTLLASPTDKTAFGLCLFMTLVVFADRFFFTPEMARLAAESPVPANFSTLNEFYGGFEIAKNAAAVVAATKLMVRRRRDSGKVRNQIDMVDEPHHRHVNR
jgi:hypothetical protein